MIEITFQHKKDVLMLLNCIRERLPSFHNHVLLLSKEDHYIVKFTTNRLQPVKELFRYFILMIKRDDWLRQIISELFHFKDPGEQQQIVQIVHSLLKGDRNELLSFIKGVDVEENVTATIEDMFVHHTSFSFDSFIKFRLRAFISNLEKYVEVAIDEYKMEQEYQMFIHMLRDFLKNRQAKINKVHLLFSDSVIFYDDHLQEINRDVISSLVDRKLLFNHPVYVDSITIAPLLSIAPNVIYIYAKEKETPLVRTIENIFEERVTLRSYQSFFQKSQIQTKVD